MSEPSSIAVLAAKLDAHEKHDETRFSHLNDNVDKLNKNLLLLSVKISGNTERIHSRFDKLMRGILFIAAALIGTLITLVYGTLMRPLL